MIRRAVRVTFAVSAALVTTLVMSGSAEAASGFLIIDTKVAMKNPKSNVCLKTNIEAGRVVGNETDAIAYFYGNNRCFGQIQLVIRSEERAQTHTTLRGVLFNKA